jgi:hypothetical protein
MSENTTVQGVTVQLQDSIELIVADLKKPLWYGDYHGGKLAIYSATTKPSMIPECTSVLIVFTDHNSNEFVLTSHYELDVPIADIMSHIQTHTIIAYHKTQAEAGERSTFVPGPTTPQ